ncbi:MAG TPA: hypothetical protein DCO73_03425 [Alphaproteobacteria bacterium]|nr:hypothetical protein [Alphaproteobacteria bacterium]
MNAARFYDFVSVIMKSREAARNIARAGRASFLHPACPCQMMFPHRKRHPLRKGRLSIFVS